MELRQLRYFVAVADTLNFSRAAESLYVSQSALSKQVAELEQELGVVLLDRDKRSVRLTDAGRKLLPEAKSILIQSEKLTPLLRHETGESQPERSLHIGVEQQADEDPAIHRVLTDAVYRQRKQIPGLRALFWREEGAEIRKGLQEGTLDLGLFLSAEPSLDGPLETRLLCEDEMVLVFRSEREYRDDRETVLEVLDKRGVILLGQESWGLARVLSVLESIGSAPQIRFCRDRTAMVLTMESGESAAILPASVAGRLRGRDLHCLHFRHPSAQLYLLAAWRADTANELPRAIASAAAEQLRQLEQEA